MSYTVLIGLNYIDRRGKAQRAEPGEVIQDLPTSSIPWLLEHRAIAEAPSSKAQIYDTSEDHE